MCHHRTEGPCEIMHQHWSGHSGLGRSRMWNWINLLSGHTLRLQQLQSAIKQFLKVLIPKNLEASFQTFGKSLDCWLTAGRGSHRKLCRMNKNLSACLILGYCHHSGALDVCCPCRCCTISQLSWAPSHQHPAVSWSFACYCSHCGLLLIYKRFQSLAANTYRWVIEG